MFILLSIAGLADRHNQNSTEHTTLPSTTLQPKSGLERCMFLNWVRGNTAWVGTQKKFESLSKVNLQKKHSQNLRARKSLLLGSSEIGSYPGIEPLLLDGMGTAKKRLNNEVEYYIQPQHSLGASYTVDFSIVIMKRTVSVFIYCAWLIIIIASTQLIYIICIALQLHKAHC